MILPKRILPSDYEKKVNTITPQIENLPFYIKETGYCSDHKLTVGNSNNYSDYLLLYTVSGVMCFSKYHSTQYIHPNNIIMTACNTPISFTRVSKTWSFFYIIISGTHAKAYYNLVRSSNCQYTVNPLSQLLDYFIEINALDFQRNFAANLRASLLIHKILYDLYEISDSVLQSKSITPVQETIVNTAIKYIQNNYKYDLDIDTICSEISFSKYYFCKIFKEHTGVTIHQYVNEYRVTKSKELLTYSKLSINAIATSVGFKNTLTFSRCFERSMNMTPSEYRRYF